MTRPSILPNYATDPLLTAGPQSGLSPRLAPGAGVLAQGYYQDRRLPARALAWLLGTSGDWLTYLDQHSIHAAAQTWRKTPLANVNNTSYQWVVGLRQSNSIFPALGADRQRLPVAMGPAASDSLRLYVNRMTDGAESEATPTSTGGSPLASVVDVCAGGGSVIMATNGPAFVYTPNSGVSWSTWSPGFGTNVRALHYSDLTVAGTTRYFFAQASGTVSYTSTVAGATTNASLPGGVAITNATSAEFADDGKSIVALIAHVASNTFPTIFYSSNSGTSWVKSLDLGGTAGNITYNKALGLFVAWDTTGVLRTSVDCSVGSWTAVGTSATAANGFQPGVGSMASLGPAIVKLCTNVAAFSGNGIAYTLDLGATWTSYTVGGYFSNSFIRIRGFNGRLYMLTVDALWVSGSLNVPRVGDL